MAELTSEGNYFSQEDVEEGGDVNVMRQVDRAANAVKEGAR